MRKPYWFLLFVIIAGCAVIIFSIPYNEVKEKTIRAQSAEQLILAKQLANSIEKFFQYYSQSLQSLAQQPDIISLNDDGKRLMQSFLQHHAENVKAITRVDATGQITYTLPFNKLAIGKDISRQRHNRFIIETHQPVVSDVFLAVQGYRTVAFVFPVFEGERYAGSITLLIPFEKLADSFLADINHGSGDHAWLLSNTGTQLYSPDSENIGKKIQEAYPRAVSLISLSAKIQKNGTGSGQYLWTDKQSGEETYLAAYSSVNLPGNKWSVAVATPETKTLAAMNSFKNNWMIITGLLIFGISVYSYFLVRALSIADKEKKLRISEEKLRDTEERFRQVAMTNWVWEIDLEGRYTYCSDNVIDTLGYTAEEMLGQTPFNFMPEEEAVRVGEILKELVAERKPVIDLENWNVTKDGRKVCLQTNGVPVFDAEHNLIGYRGADKDITAHKQAEEELARYRNHLELLVEDRTARLHDAQDELIQAERLTTLGRLTATVSHELRNPLGTIQTAIFSIDNCIENKDTPRAKRALELAERNILRCVNIIEELTSYTRVKKLELSETAIDEWMQTLLDEHVLPEGISCKRTLSCDVRTSIDREKLRQVMINLITNAVHALQDEHSKGHLLHISTHRLEDEYEIRIHDNGIGMSDETREKVFEPLYSTKGFGVGLGMVIAKAIVEQHHGKIGITSQAGNGTIVTLRFPIKLSEGAKTESMQT
jgi:PAS domain S-box-containing protein